MQKQNAPGFRATYLVLGLGLALLMFAVMPLASASDTQGALTPISHVVEMAKAGQVSRITVPEQGNDITVQYKDGTVERSTKETGSLLDYLARAGVAAPQMPTVEVQQGQSTGVLGVLGPFLPILILAGLVIGLVVLFSRRRPSTGTPNDQTGQAMQFARSRARVIMADRPSTNFDDVAGCDEAKEELAEVVDFLKHPEKYAALGARIPKGLLMVGPPGTGKTLLARAVAGEAGVPFLSISGSEFVEMFVGVGAARVRDLFEQARKNAPCIVFIDEIDAVGRHRGAGIGGGNDEREQTLNQILVEMDGFDARTNIIVVAATNRPDVLDQALMRPGRFDRQVMLDRPDSKGRLEIMKVHARGKPLDEDANLEALAKLTAGFSGADLENLMNEAALLAARRGATSVSHLDLQEGIDRVVAGPRRKGRLISKREKTLTAYHEAGHAIVAHVLPNVDQVQKITIVSRGMMGGYTRVIPTEDKHLFTRSEFKETLAWALGGQMAEQLIFGEISTGASNDIERASDIARKMVTEYGMSDRLGPIAFGHREGMGYVGHDGSERNYSNEIAYEIDKEVQLLMNEAREVALNILTEKRETLVTLAEVLIDQETLEGEELNALLDGRWPRDRHAGGDGAGAKDRPQALGEKSKRSVRETGDGPPPLAEAATVLVPPEPGENKV